MSALAFSPDGGVLAAGRGCGTISVFHRADGAGIFTPLPELRRHHLAISGVAFRPAGPQAPKLLLAAACLDGSVSIWDLDGCLEAALDLDARRKSPSERLLHPPERKSS